MKQTFLLCLLNFFDFLRSEHDAELRRRERDAAL